MDEDIGKMKISNPFTLPVETDYGTLDFEFKAFQNSQEVYAVLKKAWDGKVPPLIRIESVCYFGQIFNSAKCNCGVQLEDAIVRIGAEGGLILVAMHQDGRGISLVDHANAYALQEKGLDTVDSYKELGLKVDYRDFSGAARIIRRHYGITEAQLITNNPDKILALEAEGVNVKSINSLVAPNKLNRWRAAQLIAAPKMGHLIPSQYMQTLLKIAR